MSQDQPGNRDDTRKDICQKLKNKFIYQGIDDNMTDQHVGELLMWGTVHMLAKKGLYDAIRPDILV